MVAQVAGQVTAQVTDWGEAIMTSIATALSMMFAAIPRVLGFLVILIVGWIIAGILGKAVGAILRTARFNELAQRAGITDFVRRMGVNADPAGVLAGIVQWFVRLIVLVVAFDALGLPAVSQVIQQFLLWMPNLVVALVILVIAGLAARALSGLVRGATASARLGNPDVLAGITSVAIWGFAILIAVNQIGVASTLVNTLFMGLVAALALATGLAFGLGGRDTASQIVQNWYRTSQQAAPRVEQAASAARQQAQQAVSSAQQEMGRMQQEPAQRPSPGLESPGYSTPDGSRSSPPPDRVTSG